MIKFGLLLLLLIIPFRVYADDMCAKEEASDVCAMKEQRDYAMDTSAHYEGAWKDEVGRSIREKAYWKAYVSGLPDGNKVRAACAWRGTMSKPLAEMCKGVK